MNKPIKSWNKEVLNFDDVLELSGYSKSKLYKLTHEKKIPHYKPSKGKLFFKYEEVRDFLFSNRIATDEEMEREATRISMA